MSVRIKGGILLVCLLEHWIILEHRLRASILKPIAENIILGGRLIRYIFSDANFLGELIEIPVGIHHFL
jgi:hypothetical protein